MVSSKYNSNFKFRVSSFKSGLTLIEVMLALTILGLGVLTLVSAASKCLGVARQAKNFETARHLLGVVEVENPLQLEEEIEEGSDGGTFDNGPDGFTWSRDITIVGDEEEDGLFEVKTRVYWSDRGKQTYEEVITYLYAPDEGT